MRTFVITAGIVLCLAAYYASTITPSILPSPEAQAASHEYDAEGEVEALKAKLADLEARLDKHKEWANKMAKWCNDNKCNCPDRPQLNTSKVTNPTVFSNVLPPSPVVISQPQPVMTPRVQQVTRNAGPSWTWPGNLRSHLMSTHGYSASQLNGLSQSQLKSLHDNAHNSSRRTSFRPIMQFRSMGSYNSNCPGGNCPR